MCSGDIRLAIDEPIGGFFCKWLMGLSKILVDAIGYLCYKVVLEQDVVVKK
jgi:hypothetical protein|tara:strand:- start:353 stop:505 length:153 start_codon:yes stop_codon:yes gene_type:complete